MNRREQMPAPENNLTIEEREEMHEKYHEKMSLFKDTYGKFIDHLEAMSEGTKKHKEGEEWTEENDHAVKVARENLALDDKLSEILDFDKGKEIGIGNISAENISNVEDATKKLEQLAKENNIEL